MRAKTGTAPAATGDQPAQTDQPTLDAYSETPAETKGNTFTQDNLNSAWRKLARQVEAKDIRLSKIMINNIPKIKGDSELFLELSSPLQEKAFLPVKGHVEKHLQKIFSVQGLFVTIKVNEKKNEHKAFTASDRLELMKKKNPSLDLLMKKFDLDVD